MIVSNMKLTKPPYSIGYYTVVMYIILFLDNANEESRQPRFA